MRGFSPMFMLRLLVVAHLALLAVEFSPDLSTNGDDAHYYLLGKSLFSGNGYRNLYDPNNTVHTQYPPLFPALLGLADRLSHTPLLPKLLVGLMSASVLLLLFGYAGRTFPVLAIPLVVVTAISASIATHATLLMSEIPYLFASIGALFLYERMRDNNRRGLLFWAATLVSLCPVFIRSAGLAFSAAWVLCALLDRRYRLAVAHLLLFAGATLLLRFATEWNSPYIDQLFRKNQYDPELGFVTAAEMTQRIGENVRLYCFTIIPQALTGLQLSKNSALFVALFAGIPAAIGWIKNFLLPTRIISIYLALYAVIICMWQTQWAGVRFIIPVLPFIALFTFLGVQTLFEMLAGLRRATAPAHARFALASHIILAAALALALPNAIGHVVMIRTGVALSNDWKNFYSCADWLRLNSPADAIVCNRKPELFYLRSQRKGFVYPYSHDVDKVIEGIRNGKARYCVLDNFSWTNTSARYLYPAIMSHPELFRVVYSLRNPDTFILEFMER